MAKMSARKWLDVILLLLFFVELGGMFLPHSVHELLGLAFLALALMHNIGNRRFYEHFLHGAYTPRRWLNNASVVLFAVSLLLLAMSGMALSQSLFPQVHILDAWNWRSVHLGAAIGALVLLFVHLLLHARRYIHGKGFLAAAGLAFVLVAAGIFGLPYLDRWHHQVYVDREAVAQGEKVAFPGRVLTVYFSRAANTDFPPDVDAVSGASVMKDKETIIGNAEMIAYMVHDAVGGDIAALRTASRYPVSYHATTEAAKDERLSGKPPKLVDDLPDMGEYDMIILVYPLWWHTLPMAVEGFLREHDLAGKTIIPIVTHGGGGVADSLDALRQATNATVIDDCLDIYSSDIPAARQSIADYLKRVRENIHAHHAWQEEKTQAMGTTLHLVAEGPNAAEAIAASIAKVKELEALCGTKHPASDVNRLNEAAGQRYVPLTGEVYDMLEVSQQYSALSGGAFDVTIGALSRLWRQAHKVQHAPAAAEIEAAQTLVGWNRLHLRADDKSAYLELPGMAIDLGGLAKGFALDEVQRIYREHGIENGLIDFGTSSICAMGHNRKGEPWRIGLRHPRGETADEIIAVLPLSEAVMSTSGDAERYFWQDGQRYHHILDPRTGYPAWNEAINVTVTIPNGVPHAGMVADILSTASFVLGAKQGQAFLQGFPFPVDGAIMDSDGRIYPVRECQIFCVNSSENPVFMRVHIRKTQIF